jgi:ABC-type nitrate/sulfonate/bicarbonate transport system substrate-binding protein
LADRIRVNVFPGVQHLALFAGQAKGFFARHGLEVEIQFTPSSQAQRDGLVAGQFEIAHAAVDNAVALFEMSGVGVVIVLGGDRGMTQLFVQPYIHSVAELRGKVVIVDAPNTAYALQLKKILLMHGLKAGLDYAVKPSGGTRERLEAMRQNKDYAASMFFPPYTFLAEREGFRNLGLAVQFIGPYQDTGAFVLRKWATANAAMLESYIQAYVESLRWALAPANKKEAVRLLSQRLNLELGIAALAYDYARDQAVGFAPDARLDVEGFKNVLALRAEIEGEWGGKAPAAERYFDLTYYEHALAALEGDSHG